MKKEKGRETEGKYTSSLVWMIVVLVIVVVFVYLSVDRDDRTERELVVMILLDTVRADSLGSYGTNWARTPGMDRFSRNNTLFSQAYAPSGWTLPSIASLLTGTWPTVHGGLGKISLLTPIRDELPTAAEVLKENGFHTICIANAAFMSPMLGLDRGFDVFDHAHAFNRKIRRADTTVKTGLDLLDKKNADRMFLLFHFFDPHLDYDPPKMARLQHIGDRGQVTAPLSLDNGLKLWAERGDDDERVKRDVRSLFASEITFVDRQIENLIIALESRKLYERATVIVVADHGEEFWEHDGFEHGHTLYDELLHIPLLIKMPDDNKPRVKHEQVQLIDVFPTVFDILEITPPGTFVGQTLLPLIRNLPFQSKPVFSESTLYGEDKYSLREGDYKLIYGTDQENRIEVELFHIESDPAETMSLVSKEPKQADRMAQKLQKMQTDLQEQTRTMSQPQPKNISPAQIEALKSLGYIRE